MFVPSSIKLFALSRMRTFAPSRFLLDNENISFQVYRDDVFKLNEDLRTETALRSKLEAANTFLQESLEKEVFEHSLTAVKYRAVLGNRIMMEVGLRRWALEKAMTKQRKPPPKFNLKPGCHP
jgi:hypothetical protein